MNLLNLKYITTSSFAFWWLQWFKIKQGPNFKWKTLEMDDPYMYTHQPFANRPWSSFSAHLFVWCPHCMYYPLLSPWLLPLQIHCHGVTVHVFKGPSFPWCFISFVAKHRSSDSASSPLSGEEGSSKTGKMSLRTFLYLWIEEGRRNLCKVTVTVCKFWLNMETTLNYRASYQVCPEGLGMRLLQNEGRPLLASSAVNTEVLFFL